MEGRVADPKSYLLLSTYHFRISGSNAVGARSVNLDIFFNTVADDRAVSP